MLIAWIELSYCVKSAEIFFLAAADAGGFNNSVAEQQVGGTVFFRYLNKNVFDRTSFCNHKIKALELQLWYWVQIR